MSLNLEAIPDLSSPYALSDAQIAHYQEHGWVLLPGVCSQAEIEAYRDVVHAAVARLNRETRPLEERDTYGKAFLQITNLWEVDEAAKRFVLSRRFAEIAGQLMQVDGVRLYHDQALFKEAGGGKTPWHQDQFYWPISIPQTITMWMPLVPADTQMGTMSFANGSHREGYVAAIEISDKSDQYLQEHIQKKGYEVTAAGSMAAGDATFHSGWTLHGAPGNASDRTREVMTIIYYADGARAIEPDHEFRKADLARWMPGVKPGELAASPLNPLLYHRHG